MSIDISHADDDQMGNPADLAQALHAVCPGAVEHEDRVTKPDVGSRERSVMAANDPLFFEAEGADKEVPSPNKVVVTELQGRHRCSSRISLARVLLDRSLPTAPEGR